MMQNNYWEEIYKSNRRGLDSSAMTNFEIGKWEEYSIHLVNGTVQPGREGSTVLKYHPGCTAAK